jgi:hypothetical protein
MFPRHSHAPCTAKVHVIVMDALGAQRVLMMLTGRRYTLTRFEAQEVGTGRWRTTVDVIAGPNQVDLLEERLHRVPSVLDVEVKLRSELAATA